MAYITHTHTHYADTTFLITTDEDLRCNNDNNDDNYDEGVSETTP